MIRQTNQFKHLPFVGFYLVAIFFQSCSIQTWPPLLDACPKNNIELFRTCIEEKFPPGSNYFELENFLKRKGFNKRNIESVESELDFVFYWTPLIVYIKPGVGVSGRYDEDFNLIEVTVR